MKLLLAKFDVKRDVETGLFFLIYVIKVQNIYVVSVHARIISPSLYCFHVSSISLDRGRQGCVNMNKNLNIEIFVSSFSSALVAGWRILSKTHPTAQ